MGLKLYSGITPNSNNIHYLYSDIATFKTALSTYLLDTITLDNYRINSGVIKVAPTEQLTSANYKNVTYAINENDNVCYIVKSCIEQSGFFIFDCDVDYWGTYIAQASLSHINVLRCNRNVDIGIYDDIKATKNNVASNFTIPNGEYVTYGGVDYKYDWKYENVYIVFSLTFNVKQNAYGSVSMSGMYAMNLSDIASKYMTDNPNAPLYTNPVDIARAWVGGIYAVKGTNIFGVAVELDAQVTKAYIIPKQLLLQNVVLTDTISVASYSSYGNYDVNSPLTVYKVYRAICTKSFTIEINPNYNYYVGTINNGLKIIRDTSGTTQIDYKSVITPYDVNIVVKQGDNQKDITNEFEISLTYNSGDVTNLSAIKDILKMGLSVAEGGASGDYAGVVNKLAESSINLIGKHYYGKQQGNGDGVVNFSSNITNISMGLGVIYPYAYITCESTTDEQVNARNKGAYFDCYVSSLATIFTFALLGTGNNDDATFVQAKVQVDNVPENAITEITTRLNKGVYLVKL